MVISFMSTRKTSRDISGVCLSSKISCDVSAFSHSDTFTKDMIDVGSPED